MRATHSAIAAVLVGLVYAPGPCQEAGNEPKEAAKFGPSKMLVFGVDIGTGELVAVGAVTVDAEGILVARQTFAKDAGKRVWKLKPGDALVVSFAVPDGVEALSLEIDEVGWPEGARGKEITVIVNEADVEPLAVAKPKTFRTHRVALAGVGLKATDNELIVANNESGVVAIQGVRLFAVEGGDSDAGEATEPTTGEQVTVKREALHTSTETTTDPIPGTGTEDTTTTKTDATESVLELTEEEKKQGMTLLHKAAQQGDVEALRKSLAAGADKFAVTRKKWTALHFAAANGNVEAIGILLAAGLNANRRTSAMGGGWSTPLYLAAKEGHVEALKALAKSGADVNAAAMQSWTPLHIAATNGHTEVVNCLIELGADAGALSDLGNAPIHWAASNGHTEIIKALIEVGKADKRATNHEGWTALHFAARYGHLDAAKYCVDIGIPINGKDKQGRTPVDLSNPKFVKQYRNVSDTSKHQAVYDYLRSRKGKHGWELKGKG